MRDFLGANDSPLLCVVAFFRPPAARAGVLEPLQKWVCRVLSIMSSLVTSRPTHEGKGRLVNIERFLGPNTF